MKYEVLHNLHPALEDGTDKGFRNVGKPQSDAGEIHKRIHKRFKTRRKFEIKWITCLLSHVLFAFRKGDMERDSVGGTVTTIWDGI